MIMESDMRKKEAEENAIAEIAESSGSGPGKGIRNMGIFTIDDLWRGQ